MTYNRSKAKGTRIEYKARDSLRLEGFRADRVPSSGAAQGFKGDINFSDSTGQWVAEIKARHNQFKKIYELYELGKDDRGVMGIRIPLDGNLYELISIHASMRSALEEGGWFKDLPAYLTSLPKVYKRTFQKIRGMQKFLKGAHVLMIQDDHKPFLYIRYQT